MAGFATRPSFAGHTGSSAKTNHELTSTLDHQMGAGHGRYYKIVADAGHTVVQDNAGSKTVKRAMHGG